MAPSTTALTAVLVCTGSVCLFAIIFIASLFVNIGEFKQRFHEEAREYEVISNGVWKDITDSIVLSSRPKRTPYDYEGSIYQRKKACDCSLGPNTCPRGPAGPRGKPGYRGHSGRSGKPGYPGIPAVTFSGQGTFDFYYDKPCKRVQCPAGEPGPRGLDGPVGEPGNDGHAGINGLPGRDGLHGVDGPTGEIGKRGQPGIRGPRGVNGHKGFRYTSLPGAPGRQGVRGPPGKSGRRGITGEDGKQGTVGATGVPGRWGEYGEHGKPGEMGERGLPGDDAEYCKCPPRTQEWEEITKGGETTTTAPQQSSGGYETHTETPTVHPEQSSSAGYENPTEHPSTNSYGEQTTQPSITGYDNPTEKPNHSTTIASEEPTTQASTISYDAPTDANSTVEHEHSTEQLSTIRYEHTTEQPSTSSYEQPMENPSSTGYEQPKEQHTEYHTTAVYNAPTEAPSTVGYEQPPSATYKTLKEKHSYPGYDHLSQPENTSDKSSSSPSSESHEDNESPASESPHPEYPEPTETPKEQNGYDQPIEHHAPPTVDGGDNEKAQPDPYAETSLQRSYGSTGQDAGSTHPSPIVKTRVGSTPAPPGRSPQSSESSEENGYDKSHPTPISPPAATAHDGYRRRDPAHSDVSDLPVPPVRVIPTIRYNGGVPATHYQPRLVPNRQPANYRGYQQPAAYSEYGAAPINVPMHTPSTSYSYGAQQIQPLLPVGAQPLSHKNDIYKISHNRHIPSQHNLVFKAPDPAPLPLVNEVRQEIPYVHGS